MQKYILEPEHIIGGSSKHFPCWIQYSVRAEHPALILSCQGIITQKMHLKALKLNKVHLLSPVVIENLVNSLRDELWPKFLKFSQMRLEWDTSLQVHLTFKLCKGFRRRFWHEDPFPNYWIFFIELDLEYIYKYSIYNILYIKIYAQSYHCISKILPNKTMSYYSYYAS